MKDPTLFNRTVDILAKAYFAGTLIHGSTCACAVGNLVAANGTWSYGGFWARVLLCPIPPLECEGQKQLDATGYTVSDLIRIEHAFEGVKMQAPCVPDEDGYLGLMAVLDVLFEIHEVEDDDRADRVIQRRTQVVA